MRKALIVLSMLICSIASAEAQVSVGIALPGISIGLNLPVYPDLQRVPGYPVYYAPRLNSNYFFYDGMYWVYQQDNWYASSWYNGPWALVDPDAVPLFILRIPVRYYREPPEYFRGWSSDAPPRWGDHWGNSWEQRRQGWDNWNRSAVPAPAPLPIYQRQYSGNRYPQAAQQQVLERQHYRYQPRDAVVRQQFQAQGMQSAPVASPPVRQAAPTQARSPQPGQRASSPPPSHQQAARAAPRAQPSQIGGANVPRTAAANKPPQQARPTTHPQARQPQARQPQQGAAQRQQQAPRPQGQVKRPPQPPKAQPQARQPQARQPQARQPQARQPQARQPQQGAAQRQQPAPKANGHAKGPQGNGPAKEPTQGQQ